MLQFGCPESLRGLIEPVRRWDVLETLLLPVQIVDGLYCPYRQSRYVRQGTGGLRPVLGSTHRWRAIRATSARLYLENRRNFPASAPRYLRVFLDGHTTQHQLSRRRYATRFSISATVLQKRRQQSRERFLRQLSLRVMSLGRSVSLV